MKHIISYTLRSSESPSLAYRNVLQKYNLYKKTIQENNSVEHRIVIPVISEIPSEINFDILLDGLKNHPES